MTGNKVERIKKYIVGVHGFLVESDDDEEELVRCKDCVHWNENLGEYCEKMGIYPGSQFFCANGKRKQS